MCPFEVWVDQHAVRIVLHGALDFEQTNQAIGAAVIVANERGVGCLLFDLCDADVANYYSYAVRHAEIAPQLGLDSSFRLCILGKPDSMDVLAFMELVALNHGWEARAFTDAEEAEKWIALSPR